MPRATGERQFDLRLRLVRQIREQRTGREPTRQFASASFDAHAWEIYTSLGTGGSILMVAPEQIRDSLARTIRDQGVTHSFLPPSLLAGMSEDLVLSSVAVGSEACSADVVGRWSQGRRLVNVYGPTESTVINTMTELMPWPWRARVD